MAKEDRLDWFPCEPSRLLGALAGMKSPKQLVYLIVLLRIYECGGACPDSIEALALRTRMNKRIVTDALSELFKEQRLYQGEGGIHNWKADEVIADSFALRERRKQAGSEGGKRTAEKTKKKQHEPPSNAAANEQPRGRQLQLQDSLFSDENRAPRVEPKPAEPEPVGESVALKNPPPDPEADYFRRGREVLGASAGGMLKQLLVMKGGNVALARAAIEQASTRGDAKQYVGAMVRGYGKGATANAETRVVQQPRLGAAGIAQRIRQSIAERAAVPDAPEFFSAGDPEPGGGCRPSPPPLGRVDRAG